MKINIILLVVFSLFFVSCSKKDVVTETVLNERKLDLQVLEAYKEGMSALEGGDVLYAAKKFNEAEILFPQSEWAPKSALMAAYSYYTQDYYYDAIYELERFIRLYSFHKDISYAYYLMAISYYEQIVDEKKDTGSILQAKKYFNIVIQEFPGTAYELDAQFKLELIDDILASKEMYVGRYYFQKNKWIPAINRFKSVIDDYDTTIYVEEALHRLVEIYYILGLTEEAKKYAQVLGYNYQSSEWYEKSYSVFDKKYEKKMKKKVKKEKVKNNFLIKKFKSLFEWDE